MNDAAPYDEIMTDVSPPPEEHIIADYRELVISKKKKIWSDLVEYSKNARNIDAILAITQIIKNYKQEFTNFDNHDRIDPNVLNDASDLIFPLCDQKLVILCLRPYFLSHFSTTTLMEFEPTARLCSGFNVPDDYLSPAKLASYMQYLSDFKTFLEELTSGVMNISKHLEPLISCYLRELVAGFVMNEMKVRENELRCAWFHELMITMSNWCLALDCPEAYVNTSPLIYKDVFRTLSKHAYQMVAVDFPEKFRGILTLRYCMIKTNNFGRDELTKHLINEVEKNLLIACVDTKVILNAYAACVESLRELDATCVVMHRVCSVIKEYLKKRSDTVQQIITYITSDKKEELEKDMSNTQRSAMLDEEELKGVNDEFLPENMEIQGWDKWAPHPLDAAIGEGAPHRQGVDVFNMLVSVYGSKELFVKEYRSLLAERLSNSDKKDPVFEKRYLDLLKLRFQYSELQHCEVMLKDAIISQDVDREMMKREDIVPISGCVISAYYWPKIESDNHSHPLPQPLQDAIEEYHGKYSQMKTGRKLNWMQGIGCTEMEIEIDGVKIEKIVPNIYASVLYLYFEKEVWSVQEVCDKLEVSSNVAKRRLEWLMKQGILTQTVTVGANVEVWSLTKNPSAMAQTRAKSPELVDEDELSVDDSNDMVDSLEQYWGYTMNYIANHAANGEVKAERMHRVYRMFGSPTSAGPTIDHVTAFLQRKVALGLLSFQNGSYRVINKT